MTDNKQPKQKVEKDDVVVEEKNEIEELKQQFDSLNSQLKRAVADYQNLEKRVAEGRSELTQYVGANLIMKVLPTLDHLDMALSGASEEEKKSGWYKGVEMAIKQLKGVLSQEGLEEIVAQGQFNPALHEAVDIIEGDEGKILKIMGRGYKLNNKVIQPAKVIVGKSTFAKASVDEKGK